MRIRSSLVPMLLCFIFLGGCTTGKSVPKPVVVNFPDQPAAVLAKTPEQCLLENPSRKLSAAVGGWGYDRSDAFVLSLPPGRNRKTYTSVSAENFLVGARNEVEFCDTPPAGQRYVVLDYGTVSRTIGVHEGRMYAVWRGRVCLISEKDSPGLYGEAAGKRLSRKAAAVASAQARIVSREYWFDISDIYPDAASAATRIPSGGTPNKK